MAHWTHHATCRRADPRLFDDTRNPGPALAHCRKCPVITDCYAWATSDGDWAGGYTGIAGGHVIINGQTLDATAWSDARLRACHTAYVQGARDTHVLAGHREWDRRRKATQRARRAA